MKLRFYHILLLSFFNILLSCSTLGDIESCNYDFLLNSQAEDGNISIGKPIKLGVRVSELDKTNPELLQTTITYSCEDSKTTNSSSAAQLAINNTQIYPGEPVSHNFLKNNILWFDFTPNQSGIYSITVTVSNSEVKKTVGLTIDCSNPFFTVISDNIPEYALIDKKYDFNLIIEEFEPSKTIQTSAKIVKGSGSLYLSEAKINDDSIAHPLTIGTNTLQYIASESGDNIIEFLVENEYGYSRKIQIPFRISLPKWVLENATGSNTVNAPFRDNFTTKFDVIEEDIFDINEFNGIYRLLSNSEISLIINSTPVEQGKAFPVNKGTNVIVLNSNTRGVNQIELIVKDKYHQEKKDTLSFNVDVSTKPIEASIDRLSQEVRVSKEARFSLTLSEQNYSGIFFVELESINGNGTFAESSLQLSAGTHVISYIPNIAGTHTFKVKISDRNNQTEEFTLTVQAEMSRLNASIDKPHLILSQDRTGEIVLSVNETDYTGKYSLSYTATTAEGLLKFNGLSLGINQISLFTTKENIINYTPSSIGDVTLNFKISDDYGQVVEIPLLVSCKVLIEATSSNDGGTVTGGGFFDNGTEVALSAIARANYTFDGWYEGTTQVSTSPSYKFLATNSRRLEGQFSAIKHTISATAQAGGSVSGGGQHNHGSDATLTATVQTGYTFAGWYEGSTQVSTTTSYRFTVSGARTLQARFAANRHSIIANAQTGGEITGGGTLDFGANAMVIATAQAGYSFIGWYEGTTSVSTSPSYTFRVERDRTLEARFTIHKFNIIANAQTGGTATGSGTFNYGENATVVASAQAGYAFAGWYEGTTLVSNIASYTFKVENDHTLEARFSTKTYSIALTATTGGSVVGNGDYEHNKTVSIVATAQAGYSFIGWYENDTQVSSSPTFSFKAERNRTLQARFSELRYTVAATAQTGGSATGSGEYKFNVDVTLKATAQAGYTFAGWYEGTTQVSTAQTFSFKAEKNRTLQARFTATSYTISATAQAGGSVSGGGQHNHGSDATLTATVQTGYTFAGWYEGSTQVSTTTSYRFTVSGARTLQARFAANRHSIIANAQTGGEITGGGTLDFGANAMVIATAQAGYSFIGWYEGTTSVSTSPSYTFRVERDRTLEARFTIHKFNIIANAQTGGTATGSGTFNYGENATVVASAQAGYAFAGWYEGTTLVSNIASYTFKVENDHTLEARFSTKTYSIALTATTGGSVVGNGDYEHNKTVSIVATAQAGYSFIGWYENDTQVSSSPTFSFKAERNRTLQARFSELRYTVAATAQTGGSATGSGEYKFNVDVTLKATAQAGYTFAGWYEGTTQVSTAQTFSFKAEKNRTLQARFTATSYTISATAQAGGSVSGGGQHNHGSDATLTATVQTGYTFAGWYEGSTQVSTTTSYRFTVSGARTLQARFAANRHSIIANAQTGGEITGGGTLDFGANAMVIATAQAGYSFIGWYEGTTSVSTSPSYTFRVERDRTLEARFTIHKFNIIANAQTGGTATGSGTFNYGENATVVASAQAGYAFAGWYEGTTLVSNIASYTFKVENDHTLEARFSTKTYSIALTATTGGSVVGNGDYEHNKTVSIVATAQAGYSFIGWYENDTQVSSSPTFSFKAERNRTLQARFSELRYTVAATAQTGGSATGSGEYKFNVDVTLKATAQAGYTFAGWYEGTTQVSTAQTFSFKAEKNRTLQARFTATSYTISATAQAGGSVSGGGQHNHGSDATLTATVQTGYTFAGWYEGSTQVSTTTSYRFTVSGARTLQARFAANRHSIIANAQTGGEITGGGTLDFGANAMVIATAQAGYSFIGWYEGTTSVSTSPSYTFRVERDRTLEARFTIHKFNIIANAQTGGTATGSGTFNYGENATVVASAQAGYAFAGWYEGTTLVSNIASYTFKVENDHTLEARFSTKTYSIALTATTGGSVVGNGDYEHNKTVSIVATAQAGYSFIGWYENDTQVSSSPTFSFKAERNRTLQARFSELRYTVAATAQTGGSATGSGEYKFNVDVTLKATAQAGYTFAGWYEGTTQVSTAQTFSFKAEKNRTLQARFTATSYTISATAQAGGSVSGGGQHNHGSDATLTATVQTGYTFAGWYEGSTQVSSSLTYKFTVSGARTLQARFTVNKYTISATAQTGGSIAGGGQYNYGSEATLTATVQTGYVFAGWYEGTTQVSSSLTYKFTVSGAKTLQARFTANKYNIVLNALTGGSVTGGGSFDHNTSATIVATVQTGYTFDGWYEGAIRVSASLSYTFVVSGARTLQARFTIKKYTIVANAQTGGSVTGGNIYNYGVNATVVASAQTGYAFAGWYEGTTSVSSSPSYTFTVSGARTLEARFTINKFNIVVNALTGGSVTGGGQYNYAINATIVATVQTEYTFDGWYEGATRVSTSLSYTFVVSGARTLQARFTIKKYTIVANAQTGGSVTGGNTYNHGVNATVVATAQAGYSFIGWYENDTQVSSSPTFSFKAERNRTLQARFSELRYTVAATAQTGGSATGSGEYKFNVDVTLKATAQAGYTFAGWYEGTTQVATTPTYTFKAEKNRTLQARFSINKYTISATAQTGGSVSGGGQHNHGSEVTLTATVQTGYTFAGWYEGSTQVSSSLTYKFTVSGARTLQARFTVNKYTISATAQTGGSIAGGGQYNYGSEATLTATVQTGYVFAGWYEGTTQVSSSLTYKFTVSGAKTLQARFTANKYNIVLNALTGGSVTGGGSFDHNTSATIVATVQTGYTFDGWYEGAIRVSASLSYTFVVSGARTLQARFTIKKYTIVANAQTGGSVTGGNIYNYGVNATVVASAQTGYAFAGWYEGTTSVSSSPSYTFTVSGARTLEARFTINKFNIVVNALTGGSVTGGGQYNYAINATIVATVQTGYTFDGWYEGATRVSTSLSYTFVVSGARTLQARFTIKKYTIVANAQTGGSVTGGNIYNYGVNATVVASAQTGYTFAGWYEGTTSVSSSPSYTFTVSGARTLEARFTINKFNIVVNALTGGSVTGGGQYNYAINATIVATVQTGYTFDGWYEGATRVSTSLSYTFVVSGARTLQARFTANRYNIIVNTQTGGSSVGAGQYSFNTNATVVATAQTGYAFDGWYEGSTKVSTTLSYTFAVSGARTLEARFIANKYNIVVNALTGGSVTGSGQYYFNTNATVVATAQVGYTFSGWYEGTTKVSTYASYTFVVSGARTLEARFTIKQYAITASGQTGGSVTGGNTYNHGVNATVIATVQSAYTFVGWYEGNTNVSTSLSYTFAVLGARTLEARFAIKRYVITVLGQTGGSVTGGNTYNHGVNVTVVATAQTGYTFVGWHEGNTQISTSPSYTFAATVARTLQARFTLNQYNIVVSKTEGGIATDGGTYNHGTTITLTASVAIGYIFDGWYEGSTKVSSSISYNITVTAHRNLKAVFLENMETSDYSLILINSLYKTHYVLKTNASKYLKLNTPYTVTFTFQRLGASGRTWGLSPTVTTGSATFEPQGYRENTIITITPTKKGILKIYPLLPGKEDTVTEMEFIVY